MKDLLIDFYHKNHTTVIKIGKLYCTAQSAWFLSGWRNIGKAEAIKGKIKENDYYLP